jgi:hypothetical protein
MQIGQLARKFVLRSDAVNLIKGFDLTGVESRTKSMMHLGKLDRKAMLVQAKHLSIRLGHPYKSWQPGRHLQLSFLPWCLSCQGCNFASSTFFTARVRFFYEANCWIPGSILSLCGNSPHLWDFHPVHAMKRIPPICPTAPVVDVNIDVQSGELAIDPAIVMLTVF